MGRIASDGKYLFAEKAFFVIIRTFQPALYSLVLNTKISYGLMLSDQILTLKRMMLFLAFFSRSQSKNVGKCLII